MNDKSQLFFVEVFVFIFPLGCGASFFFFFLGIVKCNSRHTNCTTKTDVLNFHGMCFFTENINSELSLTAPFDLIFISSNQTKLNTKFNWTWTSTPTKWWRLQSLLKGIPENEMQRVWLANLINVEMFVVFMF